MLRAALAFALTAAQASQAATIALELRVFDGPDEITRESRLAVYRAGERADPLGRSAPRADPFTIAVPPGFYDVQAIQERDGRVVAIRWAERLVVMAYPDEGGRHLEVVNVRAGFGALQVRDRKGGVPDVAIYVAGVRDKEAAARHTGDAYTLFVVPAGTYDLLVRTPHRRWQTQIDVPADRTRLWLPH